MLDTTDTLLVTISCRASDPSRIEQFFRFRHRLFVQTLGWDLASVDGMEIDEFDHEHADYCVISDSDNIIGGFRAIRTDRAYLAAEVFPQLATTRDYPRRPDMWEISRFGIAPHLAATDLARLNYSLMFRFAQARGATALVALADMVYERYLRTLGIRTRRYGPPQVIGTDALGRKLRCVAGEIPLSDQSARQLHGLISLSDNLDIHDATLVLGRRAISA